MRLFLLLPLIYATAVLDTALADAVHVGHVGPDLLALLAVTWLLFNPGRRTFLTAGAIGLAADLISPGRLGLGMASFLLVGYVLTRVRTRLTLDHLLFQLPTVYLTTTLLAATLATGRFLLGETPVPLSTLLLRATGVGLYTTAVSLPLLLTHGWLRKPSASKHPYFIIHHS